MLISEELSPNDVQTVLQQLGITTENTRTDQSGWKTIKSPIRDDNKPSFGLNPTTGAWKDHGTGNSGDLVTLAEILLGKTQADAIQWIKEQVNMIHYSNTAPARRHSNGTIHSESKPARFWTAQRILWITEGQKNFSDNFAHDIIQTAGAYDCLKPETLVHFGTALVNKWGKDWLAFPYETGCQLYRRENNKKQIRSIKGSRPGVSFFGSRKLDGSRDNLFIGKSPREAMLLHNLCSDMADVIGLATGEQSDMSPEQIDWLKGQVDRSDYRNVYVFLDCDTEEASNTAHAFGKKIKGVVGPLNVQVVNVYDFSGGEYKDVADLIRAGAGPDVMGDIIKSGKAISATNAACHGANIGTKSTDSLINHLSFETDVSTAPALPFEVYESLPDTLKTRCSLIDQARRRDVFLVSSLPVVASHMPNVLAGHADGYYSPDLFTLIVADPGAGKGIASKAKELGKSLNRHLIEKSSKEKSNYESLTENEKLQINPPKDRSLFIPANSSSRAIYDKLDANGGNGLLFETEIDTMLNATSQEWGNFSDITRKAFHHEAVSINRKHEQFWIDNPRLSICLTGTFDQFKRMFESAENGHFSRYALYTFDTPRVWHSHRPTKRSRQLVDSIQSASETLFEIYNNLAYRPQPLYIDLTEQQWGQIDETFSEKMELIEAYDLSKYLHASNNRAAILALRIASSLAVLRTFEQDPSIISDADYINPSSEDMTAALWLADTFIKHEVRLYHILPKATDTDSKGQRYEQFITALPTEFATADAVLIGEQLSIPPRTIKRWLSNTDRLTRIKRGHYRKVP